MTGDPLYDGLLIGVLACAPIVAAVLLCVAAPYGRHERRGWGPGIPTRPAWILMEAPASLGFAAWYLGGPLALRPVPLVLFALWQLHYVDRAFIYPFRARVRHGGSTPLAIVISGAAFNLVNGYLNATFISTHGAHLDAAWQTDPRFLSGLVLFGLGYGLNRHSDHILRGLRRPGEAGYEVPHGGGFRFVSCPNYLGELIAWGGFALASWSLAGLAFFVFSLANLVPRAASHHRWYRQRFPDYPPRRKIIIPGLY